MFTTDKLNLFRMLHIQKESGLGHAHFQIIPNEYLDHYTATDNGTTLDLCCTLAVTGHSTSNGTMRNTAEVTPDTAGVIASLMLLFEGGRLIGMFSVNPLSRRWQKALRQLKKIKKMALHCT